MSKDAVSRHVSGGHISELIALAADAERSARADTLLDRIEDLQARTLAILEASEETREHGTALSAIREARRNLELIGEVTKKLNRTPTLNLHLNAEWIELRTVILEALAPHLEARESVLRAIERAGNGRWTLAAISGSPSTAVAFAEELGIFPDPWQHDLLRSQSGRTLLNCSRQSGKSTMAALIGLHRALYHPGSLVLILAPAERQAKETFSKVADLYRKAGHSTPPDSSRKLGLELEGGSRIEALPGSERTVRGFSGVDLLILDEAARVDDGLYYATRPMLAVSGGALIMLSSPAGRRGVFFEEWTEGAGWERYEVPAAECPRITPAFLEEERRSLPRRVFDQEYNCVFNEVDDAAFAYDDVAAAITADVTPLFGEAG